MNQIIKYLLSSVFIIIALTSEGQVLEIHVRSNQDSNYQSEKTESLSDIKIIDYKLKEYHYKYLSDGFITAGYDSIVYDTIEVSAYYTLGERYVWNQLKLKFPENYVSQYSMKQSKFKEVNIKIYKNYINQILKEAANNGYPFCQIIFDTIDIENGNVKAVGNVELGQQYLFDSIHIKSDFKIKSHYIERFLDIRKGDYFSMKDVEDIDQKISNLRYIELSRPYQLAFGEEKVDLLLYLKKQNANSFNGMIGFLPNNITTGKLLITGDINLFLLNSFGSGELISFNWKKFEALSQNLNAEFSIPYLFKTNFGIGAKFEIEKKDSSYLNTDLNMSILYGNNMTNGFEFFFYRNSSFLLDNLVDLDENEYSDFTTNLFGSSYRYMKTDNYYNPRKGFKIFLRTSFGTKVTQDDEEIEPSFYNKSYVDFSYYIPILSNMTIKLRNLTSMIYSEKIYSNELDLIGGLNNLRGFDELSLPVSSYSILNSEFRYLFEQQSALYLLYDIAYFEKRFTSTDSYNYGMGIGAGLDLKTNAGVFSIIFAVGKQNENPFQFNSSKIHFGYSSRF